MSGFAGLIEAGVEALSLPALPPETVAGLARYATELEKWGRRINLVAKAPRPEIVEKHFTDSLALLPLLRHGESRRLLDVGTGAGFPGLVVKIACPELPVTLLEPREKRVSFLRHIVRTLRLKGVDIVCGRLDDPRDFAARNGEFEQVVSRAVMDIAGFLELAAGVAAPGGRVYCMKGPRADEELHQWRARPGGRPFRLVERREFVLPASRAERVIMVFEHAPG